MLFIPVWYLKRVLFKLEFYAEFSTFFLCGQRYRLEDTKHNALDIFRSFEIKSITECFLGSRFILIDIEQLLKLISEAASRTFPRRATQLFLP